MEISIEVKGKPRRAPVAQLDSASVFGTEGCRFESYRACLPSAACVPTNFMNASPQPRIAYITAGGAGMFCGSCLRDNALAGALQKQGVDFQLIPTYTPIRTDEHDHSVDRIFFGGINVFLQQKIPLFRHLPPFVDRMLDQPWLIRRASEWGITTDAHQLGALTLSMLRGTNGNQRKEVRKLVDWLSSSAQPQLVNLTNLLIAGCIPELKRSLGIPVIVTLQGDDIFLEDLPDPYKSDAIDQVRQLAEQVDGFIVFSRYYADFMADYLRIPHRKIHVVPLGINAADFMDVEQPNADKSYPTVGYFARICHAKGLHTLVDAFMKLRQRPETENVRLNIAGWLGREDRNYAETEFARMTHAGLESEFQYMGVLDRAEKIRFLSEIDVFSVPTVYREPKGIFVLEALAAGVPVVEPEHGSFPELLERTGGGRLVRPNDSDHLADTLQELLTNHAMRKQLAREGRDRVQREFTAEQMARATLKVYGEYL